MANTKWNIDNIPDQHGKCVIITGANSGIGFEAACALAGKGAEVVLAVRNWEKGGQAAARICQAHPQAKIEMMRLDLADLGSVHRFAKDFAQRHSTLSVLINNAGVMGIPYRQTVDGFEMQFGTNHLGHFALTGLLLPLLIATPHARVVTVSSMMHLFGKINFDDLNGAKKYNPWVAYGQSKLANLLFAYELQRRLANVGANVISLGCHPGYAATNLQFGAARMNHSRPQEIQNRLMNTLFAQTAAMGALPILYAATASGVAGGEYIGPLGLGKMRGHPGVVRSSARSYDVATAQKLWRGSEELTGVRYDVIQQS
jgi:NAD(P)-dependent dehydrogenase (short-subunit alcohol dehydrogenase family)